MRDPAGWALLVAWLVPGSASAAIAPQFPTELLTLDGVMEELRAPVVLKLRDMRQNYQVRETRPGYIEFVDDKRNAIAALEIVSSVSPQTKEREELTRFSRPEQGVVYEEKVITQGGSQSASKAVKRVFLDSGAGTERLASGENLKITTLSFLGVELFKVITHRLKPEVKPDPLPRAAPGTSLDASWVVTEFHYAQKKIWTMIEGESKDGSRSIREYRVLAKGYEFMAPGMHWISNGWPMKTYQAVAVRPFGFTMDQYRFFVDEKEIHGLYRFMEQANPVLYDRLTLGPKKIIDAVVLHYFPATERKKDLSSNDRFLNELIDLRNQLEVAKTNPSLLTQISAKVTLYINAIQEGLLTFRDLRPKENEEE